METLQTKSALIMEHEKLTNAEIIKVLAQHIGGKVIVPYHDEFIEGTLRGIDNYSSMGYAKTGEDVEYGIAVVEIIENVFKDYKVKDVRMVIKEFKDLSAEEQQPFLDLASNILTGLHCCTRVWEAWQVGTMTQNDFVEADEDNDLIIEKAGMIYSFLK